MSRPECGATQPFSPTIRYGVDGVSAFYFAPTDVYGHGVLGDAIEPSAIQITAPWIFGCVQLYAPEGTVFEDLEPRLADLNGDGLPEIITINSSFDQGARVAAFGWTKEGRALELIAATPYIGTSFRWLAIIGIDDFNGDGAMDIAYIDRPHLAKTLRVWSYRGKKLREIATLRGLTNHRIGEAFISGGVRDCGNGPEMITADARWGSIMSTTLDGRTLSTRAIKSFTGPSSFGPVMACN